MAKYRGLGMEEMNRNAANQAGARSQTREVASGGFAAEVARADAVVAQSTVDGAADFVGHGALADVVEHQAGGEEKRQGIGDALARDVGSGAMDGFEDRGLGADVGTGRLAQAAEQAGDLVGEDVRRGWW